MNKTTNHPISNTVRLVLMMLLVIALTMGTGQTAQAITFPAPVDLGAAAPFAILTKAGVTNVPISRVTGDIGVSPIAASAITGFSLVKFPPGTFSLSAQVIGKIYAANYASPTPSNLTTAVSNMETAYTDAAGRAANFTDLYSGDISGKTLAPGVYKWNSGVLITTDVTLAGPSNAVWIFQIAGNLTVGSGAKVLLSGGAQAANIFWQVGGGAGAEIGTTAHMEGTILTATAIHLRTGASLNGRALAQTAVTLEKNTVVLPKFIAATPTTSKSLVLYSLALLDGWVLESAENSDLGGTLDSRSPFLNVGDDAANKQYRTILHFTTAGLPDNAVITSATLKILAVGAVGTDPFTTHGSLLADIRTPSFGANYYLASEDFQAPADLSDIGVFGSPVSNWYSAMLDSSSFTYINLVGFTQFRLHFATDDNNNLIADYMMFYAGSVPLTMRPQLIITYDVP